MFGRFDVLIRSAAILSVAATQIVAVGRADAATIRFLADSTPGWSAAAGASLLNARMTDEGSLIGFVGDFVELKDGAHRINIDAPHGYTLQLALRVDGDDVVVEGTNSRGSRCSEVRDVAWPMSKISLQKTYKGFSRITLADPKFGEPKGAYDCPSYMMVGCTKLMVILEANSEPAGAEIWINGKKQDYHTNTTLSVPYCKDETSLEVLFRLTDLVNCKKRVNLGPGEKVAVTCGLATPAP